MFTPSSAFLLTCYAPAGIKVLMHHQVLDAKVAFEVWMVILDCPLPFRGVHREEHIFLDFARTLPLQSKRLMVHDQCS